LLGSAVLYYLLISCAIAALLDCDPAARAISGWWNQIMYDRASPDTGLDGDVAIVLFFDYNCGTCRQLAQTLNDARASDRSIRLVFKNIVDREGISNFAARAALAAAKQERFVPFHAFMIRRNAAPTEKSVLEAAKWAGLDIQRLARDMLDPAISGALVRDRTLAQKLGITTLPSIIVGKRIYRGLLDTDAINAAVAWARQDAPL
jgi:protein-disulfide isomerase